MDGLDERGAQDQVLDRIAGQEHLGEDHQVGAALVGPAGPFEEPVGVPGEVADDGIGLGECDAKLSHGTSLR